MEKKGMNWLVCAAGVLALVLYLAAALRPGVWLRDTFLYRQPDGSFSGRDGYASYTMRITETADGAEAEFALDGETRHYRIGADKGSGGQNVKIEQDGVAIFTGTALGEPGDALLWREEDGGLADEVNVIVNGEYQKADLWPSCNWLYNVAVGGRRETRGSVWFLIPMGALALLLALDIRFPLLFWHLRHGLEVSGGEPSEWYYTMQRVSRAVLPIGIAGLAVMSFFVR